MKNIHIKSTIYILVVITFIFSNCKKDEVELIDYPEQGLYGENILNERLISVSPVVGYGFAANLPSSTSVKVVIKNISLTLPNMNLKFPDGRTVPITSQSFWGWNAFAGTGWNVLPYDWTNHTQTIQASGQVVANREFFFYSTGSAEIQIYENGATEPNRTKTITW